MPNWYIIKSKYIYHIQARNKDEAIEKYFDEIQRKLDKDNETFENIMANSLIAESEDIDA